MNLYTLVVPKMAEATNKQKKHVNKEKLKPVLGHAQTEGPGNILHPCFASEVC